MADVIQFPGKRDEGSDEGIWLSGPAECKACGHRWVAVSPQETPSDRLECPACGKNKGERTRMVYPATPVWACGCGERLFFVGREGIYCSCCGKEQRFP